ncbi:hypothetical protein ACFLTE_01780 [Bacteroidota bacterium]
MKSSNYIFSLCVILLILCGCEKNENIIDDQNSIITTYIELSDCYPETEVYELNIPSVHIVKQINNYLLIQAIKTELCCSTDSIIVEDSIIDNMITLKIIDHGPLSYCYCPRDVEFAIGPLNNKIYFLTLIESESSYSRDTFNIQLDLTNDIDTTIVSGKIYNNDYYDLDIQSIQIDYDQAYPKNNNPMSFRFLINSKQLYKNQYILEITKQINDQNYILIEIDSVTDLGRCDYSHISYPININEYKCGAFGDVSVKGLSRETHTIQFRILGNQFTGTLNINDLTAELYFENDSVFVFKEIINILPDSSIYGWYYSIQYDSLGYNSFINMMLGMGCNYINLPPGDYRAFEINDNGDMWIDGSVEDSVPKFIFRYNIDLDLLQEGVENFIDTSKYAYSVYMRDYTGRHHDFKKIYN